MFSCVQGLLRVSFLCFVFRVIQREYHNIRPIISRGMCYSVRHIQKACGRKSAGERAREKACGRKRAFVSGKLFCAAGRGRQKGSRAIARRDRQKGSSGGVADASGGTGIRF